MKRLSALLVALLISGCASWAEWPHENFKHNYGGQVGKRADDPSTSIARYPEDIVAKRSLPNGNVEFELLKVVSQIRDAKCLVFYEVDSTTNVIVAWRFEGDEKICVWTP
ncbi:hypothetical protein ACW7GZ_04790 [Luteimonas sp. A537]